MPPVEEEPNNDEPPVANRTFGRLLCRLSRGRSGVAPDGAS